MDHETWIVQWSDQIRELAEREMQGADPGHGIDHVARVVSNTLRLIPIEKADPMICLPAAWLHDSILLPKNSIDRSKASRLAADHAVELLRKIGYPEPTIPEIHHAIEAHSFSAGIPCRTIEARVVQDADRLEALGAIGIARCLQTGAILRQPLYHPVSPFPFDREVNDRAQSIDHFFAKLLKLPATMQTQAGKEEATLRTEIMIAFLKSLCRELDQDTAKLDQLLTESTDTPGQ